jgi:HNH endonuclease
VRTLAVLCGQEVNAVDVLQLDVSGRPQAWITTKEAAVIYASDGVAWTLGNPCHVMRGGLQRRTGLQSRIEVHPIIAVRGAVPSRAWRQAPALSNPKLFVRDRHVCAYCGHSFNADDLTREHIIPTSRGGLDSWMNCITACRLLPPSPLPLRPVMTESPVGIEHDVHARTGKHHEFHLPVRRRAGRFTRRPV